MNNKKKAPLIVKSNVFMHKQKYRKWQIDLMSKAALFMISGKLTEQQLTSALRRNPPKVEYKSGKYTITGLSTKDFYSIFSPRMEKRRGLAQRARMFLLKIPQYCSLWRGALLDRGVFLSSDYSTIRWEIGAEIILALQSKDTIKFVRNQLSTLQKEDDVESYVEVIDRPEYAGGKLYGLMKHRIRSEYDIRFFSYFTTMPSEYFIKLLSSSGKQYWEVDFNNAVPQTLFRMLRDEARAKGDEETERECDLALQAIKNRSLIRPEIDYSIGKMDLLRCIFTLLPNIDKKKNIPFALALKMEQMRISADFFADEICKYCVISTELAIKIWKFLKKLLEIHGHVAAVDLLFGMEKILKKFVEAHMVEDENFGKVSPIIRKHDALYLQDEALKNELCEQLDKEGILYKVKTIEPIHRTPMTERHKTWTYNELFCEPDPIEQRDLAMAS